MQAMAMIRAIYDDGEAEINGRVYRFSKMVHKERRKVFAFYSSIQDVIVKKDFSFLDTEEFDRVERVINDRVLFEGSALSRLPDHWDKYPGDYLTFIPVALGVISYPFLSAALTS